MHKLKLFGWLTRLIRNKTTVANGANLESVSTARTIQTDALGDITIKLPTNRHLMLNLSASLVSGTGGNWQCLLCDKQAPTGDALVKMTCPSPRIYEIKAFAED